MTYDIYPGQGQTQGGQANAVKLICSVCGGNQFNREEARCTTRHGFGSFVFEVQVCIRCRHAVFFLP